MLAQQKPYSDWESLRTHKVPDWAQDAKFGIYAHWGVYSVGGNWDYTKNPTGVIIILLHTKGYYSTNETQEQRILFEKHIKSYQRRVWL